MTNESVETLIIGGSQSGLAAGYYLAKKGRSFRILDANDRIGDAWRNRWESLRLFTPAKYDCLPGMRFPAGRLTFPTKDEMGDYLESYAARFALPYQTGVRVDSLSQRDGRFHVTSRAGTFSADNVIIATGAHQLPRVPDFAPDLDEDIVQLHSVAYKNPRQLADGPVLVVGVGNSGAEIAHEVAKTHPTIMSGAPSAQIPVKHGRQTARFVLPVVRLIGHHVLSMRTPIGRKVGPEFVKEAAPLIRIKLKHLRAAGVEQVGRTTGVRDGRPVIDNERVLDVANVIWCTGFRQDYSWVDLPAFDEDGRPIHSRGVSPVPGLYFMGLIFQFAATSDVVTGVGRDAAYVVDHLATAARTAPLVTVASGTAAERRDAFAAEIGDGR
jgi:putative flavoprotein involved in K+ transport